MRRSPGSAVELAAIPGSQQDPPEGTRPASPPGTAAIPGTRVPAPRPAQDGTPPAAPVTPAAGDARARSLARIPGVQAAPPQGAAARQAPYRRHQPQPAIAAANDTSTREAFISAVAPGAIAAQRKYGVPAAVTIAQAIEESGWGQSSLAAQDNNLFGIKGTGPAGSDELPTQEYLNGQWVSQTAAFRVYHSVAQSIDDHGKLLATSGYYTRAMAARRSPNAFAAALTGVYATDPTYGATLIGLMRQYNLYRYDAGVATPAVSGRPGGPGWRPGAGRRDPGGRLGWPGGLQRAPPRGRPGGSRPPASPRPTASGHATTTPSAPQATPTPPAPDSSTTPATPQATPTQPASDPSTTPATPAGHAHPAGPPSGHHPAHPARHPRPAGRPSQHQRGCTHAQRHPGCCHAEHHPGHPRGERRHDGPEGSTPGAAAIPGIAATAPGGRASGLPVQAVTRADWIAGAAAEVAGRAAHSGGSIELTAVQMPLSRPAHAAGAASAGAPAARRPAISRATEERLADLQAGADRTASARPARAQATVTSRTASPATASARPGVSRAVEDRLADLQQPRGQQATSRSPATTDTPGAATAGTRPARASAAAAAAASWPARPGAAPGGRPAQAGAATTGRRATQARPATARLYQPDIPPSVRNAFITTAKAPLIRDELLYRDVANQAGISWKLLAACDWMQCQARPGYSAVHGEKVGTVNADGTVYLTRSAGLGQCADDLLRLAGSVYGIDLTARVCLSIADLANVFAAFRWGQLLQTHHTSAMEFPYSVAGLTAQHLHMRWPRIPEAPAPDKPGGRFRRPFGALPVVLGLHYPATA